MFVEREWGKGVVSLIRFGKRTALSVLDQIASFGARRYIAGRSCDDALTVYEAEGKKGHNQFIICPWDRPEETPAEVHRSYRDALEHLLRIQPFDCYLSVKFPSLGFDLGRVRELVQEAAKGEIRVHFDALLPDSVDRTLKMLEVLRPHFSNLGYTIPSRWKRSVEDLERLIALHLPVRLVKGQLPDRASGEVEPRGGCHTLARMLQGYAGVVGIASHDAALVMQIEEILQEGKTPYEVEQLFRLPPVSISSGAKIRWYVPYGYGYPPYDVSTAVKSSKMVCRMIGDVGAGLVLCLQDFYLSQLTGGWDKEEGMKCAAPAVPEYIKKDGGFRRREDIT